MQETEAGLLLRAELAEVIAHAFEQAECADDVGRDEIVGAVDRAVDMRLRREVDNRARPCAQQQRPHEVDIADVALHEAVAWIVFQLGQIGEAAGIGQLVQRDDRRAFRLAPVPDKIRADESRAAGDEDGRQIFSLGSFRCHVGSFSNKNYAGKSV
jgi:hypothetical protein